MILIHDIKEDFNITYLHVKFRSAPKQDRDDRKRNLETNAQTNDSSGFIRNLRQKKNCPELRRGGNEGTAEDKLKLLEGCDNHMHFQTKTEISAFHKEPTQSSLTVKIKTFNFFYCFKALVVPK